jgi:hypothetical protein
MKTLSEVANAQVSTDLPAPVTARSESTAITDIDPGLVMTSCANCGAQMLERKCKLICSCGYFLSCSDYY